MREGRQKDLGFTIIEMMVVLAIMAMTMTMVPAIVSGLDGSRLRAASDDLIARLREARSQAVRRDATTVVELDPARRGYAISIEPGFHPLPAVVDKLDVQPAALLDSNGIARIRFLADGTADQARISLHHGGAAITIAVDWLTGRVGHDD